MSKVSCIITSYNNMPYLEKAIQSVLCQTHAVDEIIIADDASSDGSQEIIEDYASRNKIIKPIFRPSNLGVSANRDLAARDACGDCLTFLDGDDTFYSEKIENEMNVIKHENDVAYSDVSLADHDLNIFETISLAEFSTRPDYDQKKGIILRRGGIPTHMLLTKCLYLAVGGMRHELSIFEDWDFKIRLAMYGVNWRYSGVKGMVYRKTGEGLSSQDSCKQYFSMKHVLQDNKQAIVSHLSRSVYYASLLLAGYRGIKGSVCR